MKKITATFTICFIYIISFAQISATTDEGKRVTLNPDGTWVYAQVDTTQASNSDYTCESLITTEVDRVSGTSTTAAKEMVIVSHDGGTNGIAFFPFISSGSNTIVISMSVYGASSCIDEDSKMNVLFRDGSRLVLTNDSKFNCEKKYTLYFGGVFGKKKELEQLSTKEIDTVRVWTSKGYVEETFDSDQSKTLMNILNCLKNQ